MKKIESFDAVENTVQSFGYDMGDIAKNIVGPEQFIHITARGRIFDRGNTMDSRKARQSNNAKLSK